MDIEPTQYIIVVMNSRDVFQLFGNKLWPFSITARYGKVLTLGASINDSGVKFSREPQALSSLYIDVN